MVNLTTTVYVSILVYFQLILCYKKRQLRVMLLLFTNIDVTFSKFNLIEKIEFYIYVEGASFNWEVWNIS